MKKKLVPKIIQSEKEVPVEIIADALIAISEGIKALRKGRLNDKALILLIQNAAPMHGGVYGRSKVGTTEIKAVLAGMEDLEKTYLK